MTSTTDSKKTRRANMVVVAIMILVGFALFVLLHTVVHVEYISTNSMSPTIPAGSLVVDTNVSTVHIGDIITARDPYSGSVATHRVMGVASNGGIITKGDANKDTDTHYVPMTIKDVLGRVLFSFPIWTGIAVFVGLALVAFAVIGLVTTNKKNEDDVIVEPQQLVATPA